MPYLAALFQQTFADSLFRQCRQVVVLAEMGQKNMDGGLPVNTAQELGGIGIGQVANGASDPPLKVERVGTVVKHVRIMIGFNDDGIGISHGFPNHGSSHSQVGSNCILGLPVIKAETDRVNSIVRNRKWYDFNLTYHCAVVQFAAAIPVQLVSEIKYIPGSGTSINRQVVFTGKNINPAYMVAVFVSN